MKQKHVYITIIAAITLIIATSLAACGELITQLMVLKGELIGNDYRITEYDNFGERTITVNGNKVSINAETDSEGELTSYIDITIDGYDWKHVGSTLIFAQNGVDMITDFSIPDEINTTQSSSGLMAVDRFINNYRNRFGSGYVVIVSTQNGTPLCLFRGNRCNVSYPSNLPKMTLVNIDGKLVYIHRANINIMSVGLFDN